MKFKFLIVALLLISFCGGTTQANECEVYVAEVNKIVKNQWEPFVEDTDNIISLYLSNGLSDALAKKEFSSDLPNDLNEIINSISLLEPTDTPFTDELLTPMDFHNWMIGDLEDSLELFEYFAGLVDKPNQDTFNTFYGLLIQDREFFLEDVNGLNMFECPSD